MLHMKIFVHTLVAIIKISKEKNDCKGVVDAMTDGSSSEMVAEHGCAALCPLASNAKRIAAAGGIAIILSTMKEHGSSNASVAQNGCGVLWHLASSNTDNKKSIGETGGIAT